MRRTNHRNLVNVGILSGRIPLISLVQFIAVAEHLNFRHAAKALGISQSSVSARVKALEDNLGVLLFGTGWQCLATAGISAEGKRTFR
ncbi:helix-turn-helix domain-containing protein [Aeromonas salmonicida]|uniref:helix-turn-helix domain-containing protein n=1 Tax=Aeromonas salmonicida TaxID=645 RepID=UPI000DE5BB16|nr:LysR family transcriptional regulator [Aeromonas salmonicida]